jgi:hypothetical protein
MYLHPLQAAVLTIVCNKSYRRCPGVESTYMHTHIRTYIHTYIHTQANNIICTKIQKPKLIYVAGLHFVLEYSQPSYTTEQLKHSWCILNFRGRNNSHKNNRKLQNQLRKICRWKRKESNNEKSKTRNKFPPSFQVYSSQVIPQLYRKPSKGIHDSYHIYSLNYFYMVGVLYNENGPRKPALNYQ